MSFFEKLVIEIAIVTLILGWLIYATHSSR